MNKYIFNISGDKTTHIAPNLKTAIQNAGYSIINMYRTYIYKKSNNNIYYIRASNNTSIFAEWVKN